MTSNWELVPLGELVKKRGDFTPVAPEKEYEVVGIQRSGWGFVRRAPVRGDSMKFSKLMKLEEDDLAYRVITAFEAPSAVVGKDIVGKFVTPQTFPVFKLDHERILPSFMSMLTTSPAFHAEMAKRCTGTVLRRKTLSVGSFREIPIDLPPLIEQRRIVDLIGALDDAIEAADEAKEKAETLYRSIIQKPYSTGQSMKLSEVVTAARSGGTPSRKIPDYFKGDIPWVKSGEIESDSVKFASEYVSEDAIKNSSAWVVPVGSTLVAMYGQGNTKGKAGFVVSPVSTNQAVLALVPDLEKIRPKFLFHTMRSRTESLRSKAIGAAQPNLSKGIILDEEVVVPNLNEQGILEEAFSSIQDTVNFTAESSSSLRNLRTELLSSLLSGAHEIPESYDEVMNAV